jgi:hypothetical protein
MPTKPKMILLDEDQWVFNISLENESLYIFSLIEDDEVLYVLKSRCYDICKVLISGHNSQLTNDDIDYIKSFPFIKKESIKDIKMTTPEFVKHSDVSLFELADQNEEIVSFAESHFPNPSTYPYRMT